MRKSTILLLIVALSVDFSFAGNCDLGCSKQFEDKEIQNKCNYIPNAACPKSDRYIMSTLITDEKIINLIVTEHNKLRQFVASGKEKRGNPGPQPGGLIPDLKWDPDLAKYAQFWINRCVSEHDPCIRQKQGQNIASFFTTEKNVDTLEIIKSRIQHWYDEVELVNGTTIQQPFSFNSAVGHYTQIVWAKTTKVGCGSVIYSDKSGSVNVLFCCNYLEPGNSLGQKIY